MFWFAICLALYDYVCCDFAIAGQLLFQDSSTPVMEGICDLHHDIMFVIIFVSIGVLYLLYRVVFLFTTLNEGFFGFFLLKFRSFNYRLSSRTKNPALEIGWTVFPAAILALIAVPSFALLYAIDEIVDPVLTLKIIGRQWNWSYEYSECGATFADRLFFDSFMVEVDDLKTGDLRLLTVDKRVYLPLLTHIRLLITSSDVLHCWAVPSLGVKMDAVPGRLNQSSIFLKREGVFYGMCSEICGINHGFMPICIQSLSFFGFEEWAHSYDVWVLSFRDFLNIVFLPDHTVEGFLEKQIITNTWFCLLNMSFGACLFV
jgi:cytochrome c oxidase subunit 2